MDIKLLKGFDDYLSIEDDNIEKSISILEKDYQLFHDLDYLYNICLNIQLPFDSNLLMPAFLYLISHQELYSGMASFLRLHKTHSFRCLRAALDSTFTAYYLLKNPEKTEIYLNRNSDSWEKLFRNMKPIIKNNQKDFPLAAGLSDVHDLCSKFAHADPEGIFHKYSMDRKELRLHAQYFDYEETPADYKKWFSFLLFNFFKVFLIYWNEMLKNRSGKMRKEIEYLVTEYRINIKNIRKKYPLQ